MPGLYCSPACAVGRMVCILSKVNKVYVPYFVARLPELAYLETNVLPRKETTILNA